MDENSKLKLQIIGSGTSVLETMMTQFRFFHLNPSNAAGLPGPPKAGDYVVAKFTEDGGWYRARVRSNDRPAKEAEVVYIEYGNSEIIHWSRLRLLSQSQFSTQTLCLQAFDAVFSFIQLPTHQDYLPAAIKYFMGVTTNRELVANVNFTAPEGILYIELYDPKDNQGRKDNINADIVSDGWAMVPAKQKGWERGFTDVLKLLRAKMAEAKEARLGIWVYGDIEED